MSRKQQWAAVAVVLTAILAAIGIPLVVSDDDRSPPPKNVTVTVNAKAGDGKPTTTVEVPRPVVEQAERGLEDDLRDETPPEAEAVAPQQLAANEDTAAAVKLNLPPLPTAGASAGFAGCATRFVRNQSSRRGVRPIWQVLHYTVSPNRPGWSDVNAVVALFNRPASQASSHFVIDAEGHCAYIVPIEAKSWTEAAGNSLSVSYEVINSGREATFLLSPGYRRLASVMREVARRTGIPMRAGSVYPARSGIVQHKDGQLPWGGHVDIAPFVRSEVVARVIRESRAASCSTKCRALRRTRDLRARNRATHRALRARRCPARPTRGACLTLRRRHAAIHAAARRERIRL